jgi:nucleotide-binding universal stress UspA family protein
LFGAKIHLLGIYSTSLKSVQKRIDAHVEYAANYLTENGVLFVKNTANPDDPTRYINKFAEEINAELISIMTEQETTTANLFLGPAAQQLICYSKIPILSVRPKKIRK